ncbi:VPLPA-CTERM-specific exosortase XrtD [Desulfobacter latus]|uniref:VPLPA-CTERM-specific exosortase XrtD n=1 Tax=Desulfobacter latus TaxID=2292 RepID=A0A850SRB5_9BACT|nr:VPLPA-CTERM-specific exosortase XrtD [Desulfobacter latus]NWH03699.1 VPLPA-CTERM-specific exosortase XrtD [Desulfobacter latus]
MSSSENLSIRPFYLKTDFLILTGLYGLLLLALYYSSLQWLVLRDWVKDDYSHCILIPFIIGYLVWEKHRLIDTAVSRPSKKGFYLFIPGLCLFWLGELAGEYFTSYFSLWMLVFGLCWIHLGWKKLKIVLFPMIFSLSMFPLPNFINNRITLELKLLSSKIGVMMMQVYGMSAYREGNVIDLGFTRLQVVDACSGLRYLFPMIVLSILVVYFYPAKFWKRAIVVASSIPLTIFSNSLRIALTGILSQRFGAKVTEGFFHDFEGLMIFMFTLGVLLFEIWILKLIFPEPKHRKSDKVEGEEQEKVEEEAAQGKVSFLRTPQFIVSIVLLVITLGLSQGIEFREAIPMTKSFDKFPKKIKEWEGDRQLMELRFIEELDLTDYFMADYKNDSGKAVNFYVAYYESQRKGESIHSPASCLPGGGWRFKQAGVKKISLEDGTVFPAKRALIEKAPVTQLSYYWFPFRGRILTNAYQMKIYNFWDALTRQRTDGALVRVITLIYGNETIEDAERRIQDFISDVQPVLRTYLPE